MAKHVLHILGTARPEGTSTAQIVRSLALGMDPDTYQFHALFLGGTGPLVNPLRQAGINACAIEWERGMLDPKGALNFWEILRKQRFDIMHVHFGGRGVIRLARIATKAKIVRHLHGRILEPEGLTPVSFRFRGVDAVIAVSQAVADRIQNHDVHVIYAGVAVPPTVPQKTTSESILIVGTAGRLVKLKGIDFLLDAAVQLKQEFPFLQLEIAGSGPELNALQEKTARLGLQECVRFLGWIDDLTPILRRWDIFAMPSFEEGFPIAALNAMAAGLPIVATKVGGVPELIEDHVSGLFVSPGDMDSLAGAIRFLIKNREARLSMGTAGFDRVRDRFSIAQMTTKTENLYESLLSVP